VVFPNWRRIVARELVEESSIFAAAGAADPVTFAVGTAARGRRARASRTRTSRRTRTPTNGCSLEFWWAAPWAGSSLAAPLTWLPSARSMRKI